MPSGQEISTSVYEGPNLIVPFAAAVVEFPNPYLVSLASSNVQNFLAIVLNITGPVPIAFASEDIDFPHLAAALALPWQETDQPLGLSSDISHVTPLIGQLGMLAHSHRFGSVSYAYIMAAKSCGIPIYEVAPGTNEVSYGQGAWSIRYSEAMTENDSVTGHKLAQSKSQSNQFVKRLGFPGVEHEIVQNLPAARRAAARLGAPLVVKPIDRNGAVGVSVGVENNAELERAFATASRLSQSSSVPVERFVPGACRQVSPETVNVRSRKSSQLIISAAAKRKPGATTSTNCRLTIA